MTTSTGSPEARAPQVSKTMAEAERLRSDGRYEEAERACRHALELAPANVGALNFLSLLLARRGGLDEAETLMRKALSGAPSEAVLHNNLGNILYKRAALGDAQSSYRRAIELKEGYPEAHHNLGIVLRVRGNLDEALAAQKRAVDLRPGYGEALTEIGVVELARGNTDDALSAFGSALKANPDHFDALYYMGTALTSLSRHQEAAHLLKRAVALRPESHEAHYALGNVLNYLNEEAQAFAEYRRTIELKPDFAPAHYDFSSLAWTMGRRDLSLSSYAYARGRIGDRPDLLLAEAEARIRLNQARDAEALLRRALELSPERADIANALGRALTTLGRHTESIPLLELAIARDPNFARHRLDLAIAFLHEKRSGDAIELLKAAEERGPLDQLGLGLLSLAYRETGDRRFAELFDKNFVGVFDVSPPDGFADVASFNAALADDLSLLHTRRTEPFDQTLRGGTQTMGHLFFRDSQQIARFRERVGAVIGQYIRALPDDATHPFLRRKSDEFSYFGAWSCRLRSSGFHTNHVHPQGWISSAYYVAVPDVAADETGRQGWLKFGESNLELSDRDRPELFVQPKVGRLVLFPSYFWHGTVPFTSSEERLTIAFDVVPGKHAFSRPFVSVRNY